MNPFKINKLCFKEGESAKGRKKDHQLREDTDVFFTAGFPTFNSWYGLKTQC